jgi:hypothetical protein
MQGVKNRKVLTRSQCFWCLSLFLFYIKLAEKKKIRPVGHQPSGPLNYVSLSVHSYPEPFSGLGPLWSRHPLCSFTPCAFVWSLPGSGSRSVITGTPYATHLTVIHTPIHQPNPALLLVPGNHQSVPCLYFVIWRMLYKWHQNTIFHLP